MPTGLVLRDLLPPTGPEPGIPARQMAEMSGQAEALGYHSVWVTEGRGKESFAMLGAMAMATRRIGLGTSILPIFSRPPTVTAMAAATLSDLSGGRAILGLGAGHPAVTESGHGISVRRPIEAMQEYVQAVRLILSGRPVRHDGRMVKIREFQLEFTPPHRVRIFLAGLGPRMLQLVGALGDGAILTWFPPARIDWARAQVAAGARQAGRDPGDIPIVATARVCAAIGEQRRAAARATARRQLATYAGLPVYARMWRESGFAAAVDRIAGARSAGLEAAAGAVPDEMLEAFVAVGDRSRVRAHVDAYAAAGADVVLAYPIPAGEDPARSVRETLLAAAPREAPGGQE